MSESVGCLKRLVIIGARKDGSAKVVLDIIRLMGCYHVAAFVDDDMRRWGEEIDGVPVVGATTELEKSSARNLSHFAVAVGDNWVRERLILFAATCGLQAITALHPTAVIARDVSVGKASWLAAGAIVNPGARIGSGVTINTAATIDHDCIVQDYANISPGCHLSGRVIVRSHAFLGTGVIVLPDIQVGEGAVVGAGAVVTHDVPAGATVVGVPARVIRSGP